MSPKVGLAVSEYRRLGRPWLGLGMTGLHLGLAQLCLLHILVTMQQ